MIKKGLLFFSYFLSLLCAAVAAFLIWLSFQLIGVDRQVAIGIVNENERINGLSELNEWTIPIIDYLHKNRSYKEIQKYMSDNLGWDDRIKTLAFISALKIELIKRK